MSKGKQQIILIIGLGVMALLGLFPPAVSNVDLLAGNEIRAGYSEPAGRAFLWAPSKPVMNEKTLVITRSIDYSRLAVEWIVLGLLMGMGLMVAALVDEQWRTPQPAGQYEEAQAA